MVCDRCNRAHKRVRQRSAKRHSDHIQTLPAPETSCPHRHCVPQIYRQRVQERDLWERCFPNTPTAESYTDNGLSPTLTQRRSTPGYNLPSLLQPYPVHVGVACRNH